MIISSIAAHCEMKERLQVYLRSLATQAAATGGNTSRIDKEREVE